jgi:hypothetical protein
MAKSRPMNRSCLRFCTLVFLFSNALAAQSTTFQQAVAQGWIQLEARSLGGYQGDCLQLVLQNQHSKTLRVLITPGMVFKSQDTLYQDLILVDQEDFLLSPKQKKILKINAYCCKMHRGGPDSSKVFTFEGTRSAELNLVADYLYRNALSKSNLVQPAIWAVSDNADLAGIWDPAKRDVSQKLIEFVAKTTNRPVPWYRAQYAPQAPGPQMAKRPMMQIFSEWEFNLGQTDKLSLAIYDQDGKQVDVVMQNRDYTSGIYTFNFSYKTNKLPNGRYYYFRMHGEKSGLLKEKRIYF